MDNKAEYKSAIRSKQMIRQAFFDLLQKKPAEKITVTDIVKTANINRGTFYAHYSNVRCLIDAIEEDFINQLYDILEKISVVQSPLDVLLKISEFLENDVELYKKLANVTVSLSFVMKLQNIFVSYMLNCAAIDEALRNSREFKARANFFSAGVATLYMSWLKGETDGSLTELAYTLNDIILDDSLLFHESKRKQNPIQC